MDLFTLANEEDLRKYKPLATRMRPKTLDEFVGQEKVIGKGRFLRRMIESDCVPSILFYGPPGTGKTTLAQIIANSTGDYFEEVNAVSAGVADLRKIISNAQERLKYEQKRTILFVDEIHRFNKGQQDVLLPYVENGGIILVGATTENPYFEVNSPLLSRMRVIKLEPLCVDEIMLILKRAINDPVRGFGYNSFDCDEEVLRAAAELSSGDSRIALNILEQAVAMVEGQEGTKITLDVLKAVVGEKLQKYDKHGDNHYDVVSAFIKSMRGSDPDAALHYFARMLESGEDLNFIARRIVICAAEDVGNADPQALVIAMAAAKAAQFIGLPEARIPLAQAICYISTAPKSNAAYLAVEKALNDVRSKNCGSVPTHLRDAHYKGAQKLGNGVGYLYPHDYPGKIVGQQYMPTELSGVKYYQPIYFNDDDK